MDAELKTFATTLVLALGMGAAVFLIKVILSILLKWRLPAGLVPGVDELGRSDSTAQFFALLGQGTAPVETLGTLRLRATLGLQLAYWGGSVLMALVHNSMGAPVLGIETLILLALLLTALHTSLYEISFDRQSVTLPRWWFGRTTHRWADLEAVVARDPWFLTLCFAKGRAIKVHKYIVGYARLVETAQQALREL